MASSSQFFDNDFRNIYKMAIGSINNNAVSSMLFKTAFLLNLAEIVRMSSANNKENLIKYFNQLFSQDIDDIYSVMFKKIIKLSRYDKVIGQFIDIFCKNFIQQIKESLNNSTAIQKDSLFNQLKLISQNKNIKNNFSLDAMLQFVIVDLIENNCLVLKSDFPDKNSITDFIDRLNMENKTREAAKKRSGIELLFNSNDQESEGLNTTVPETIQDQQRINASESTLIKRLIEVHLTVANKAYCTGEYKNVIDSLQFVLKHEQFLDTELKDTCLQFLGLSFLGIAEDLIKSNTEADVILEALSYSLHFFDQIKQFSKMEESFKVSNVRLCLNLYKSLNQQQQSQEPPQEPPQNQTSPS